MLLICLLLQLLRIDLYRTVDSRTIVFVHVFPDVTQLLPVFWIFSSLLNQGRLYLEELCKMEWYILVHNVDYFC